MPNPVPLATKEEEDRRAWVTAHHEVVRLVKDCFGDRFSNNEIFDRLKISRRTGYRALGNDERIGKAPGRKPKITEDTIKDMIEYIETGGCNDVGNVWKHLAEKFAPNCNPKTVQDAVKKSGFTNYRDTVKLQPLLALRVPDQPTPNDEAAQLAAQQAQQQQQQQEQHQHAPHVLDQDHQSVIDSTFQQHNVAAETLRSAIESAPESHVRYVLLEVTTRFVDAANLTSQFLCPFVNTPAAPPMAQMAQAHIHPSLHSGGDPSGLGSANSNNTKRSRIAICRRCNQQYDRSANDMNNRECLYHKGSPQKISPEDVGTLEQSPQAYIWSCCGGNGLVRGCCRAMHTTKKKRKYGKKRDASTAGLDGEDGVVSVGGMGGEVDDGDDSGAEGETTMTLANSTHIDDSQIDSTLQDAIGHPSYGTMNLHQMQSQMSGLPPVASTGLHQHQHQQHATHPHQLSHGLAGQGQAGLHSHDHQNGDGTVGVAQDIGTQLQMAAGH